MDKDVALLHEKIDYLTEQFEAQRRRQDEINELMTDAVPVVNHMIKLSIDELAEIGTDFQLEDLTFLLKRLLRDTRMLVGLLDQVEAVAELAEEGQVMGKRIFHQVTTDILSNFIRLLTRVIASTGQLFFRFLQGFIKGLSPIF